MRNAETWRRDRIYSSIRKILKQKVKKKTLQKALKYMIREKKFEILSKLDVSAEHDNKPENNYHKSDIENDGIEILKKIAPSVIDGETEMSESDSDSENDELESDIETEVENYNVSGGMKKPVNAYSNHFIKKSFRIAWREVPKVCIRKVKIQ